MKVVASEAPPGLVEQRRRLGHDRFDEMWEGVLHMNAVPHCDHQDLALQLGSWLLLHWGKIGGNKAFPERNVSLPGGWPEDYRIPDLVLTTTDRSDFERGTHIEGPPLVCIEIHSPHDEAYEKLEFYARLGVPEIWVIDRDTKRVELFALDAESSKYELVEPSSDGWLLSSATNISLMTTEQAKLAIRFSGDDANRSDLPEG